MTKLTPSDLTTPLGLLTDLYELRMAQTCLRNGRTGPATFSLYIRPDPRRPWFLAAGTAAALEVLDNFRYEDDELGYLRDTVALGDDMVDWLADFRPTGEVHAVADGTVVLGDEPLLEYRAPLPEALILETALLNAVQYPTLIGTKAARAVLAAGDRPIADFGARRAHGLESSVHAARAAYLGGCASTSNVEAGRRFGIPVAGTMAHAFIQAWGDELEAFRAFAEDHPDNTIMLVDTYDVIEGVENAIVLGKELRERGQDLDGIRLDSGDLVELAIRSRRMLDDAGFTRSRIFASGGIDEFRIAELLEAGAPIDAWGLGTSLTTSRDVPAFDIAYKLVEYEGEPRAKYSEGKVLLPGAKQVFRDGGPDSDVLARRDEDLGGEALLQPVWRDGAHLADADLLTARDRAAAQLDTLPDRWRRPDPIDPAPEPRHSEALGRLAEEVRDRELHAG